MKVIGIIAEYNPFHNGHAYQIAQIRRLTNADYIVVAMSGDFVQRGTPAIIDKYARAKMALSCGADFVFELPTLWATASAESFAMAGITLFEKMGCVDGICFGAETDNLPLLSEIAELLVEEPPAYQDALSSFLKEGLSFPAARVEAVCEYLAANPQGNHLSTSYDVNIVAAVMNEPNNILAIEYLKSIKRRGNKLTPYLIKREGARYHESSIRSARDCDETTYDAPTASATAIRNMLIDSLEAATPAATTLARLNGAMPAPALNLLTEYLSTTSAVWEDDLSSVLGYLLLCQTKEDLSKIADCNEEIANRILKNLYQFSCFSEFCALNKSRDITYTRMSRILLHLVLNFTDTDYEHGKQLDYIPYLRLLGFRRDSSALFGEIKKKASSPLISKLADATDILESDALWMLGKDIFAADLYTQTAAQKAAILPNTSNTKKTTSRSEYTREIVLL